MSRVRGVVHAAFAQAVRWEWIWSNPASNAARFEAGPQGMTVPPPETVMRVLDWLEASDPALMLFVRLAATTGARRGEILGLRWDDIDFVNGRVRLARGLIDAVGGPVLQERKAKNANCVDLDHDTLALLERSCRNDLTINGSRPRSTTTHTRSHRATPTPRTSCARSSTTPEAQHDV